MPAGFDEIDKPSGALADACVHCGFCLPACPTYVLWNEEMDSPRGRIHLMKAALAGRADPLSESFRQHFDACLGCMACVTACPSGVRYGPLLEKTRGQIERHHRRPLGARLFRAALFRVLPYPNVLRALLLPMTVLRRPLRALARFRFMSALPASWRALLTLAPRVSLRSLTARPARRAPAISPPRLRAGVLEGCVQRVVSPEVNEATIRVLAAEGCETVLPSGQGCCGALSRHAGRLDEARSFARRTIETFEGAAVDVVVVNAAGCGSSMKEYGELFADDPAWAARAEAFRRRVRDVCELLEELGEPRAKRHPLEGTVAYHDACHLAHAQGVRKQPRDLLKSIPGLTVVDLPESDLVAAARGSTTSCNPKRRRRWASARRVTSRR